jgi:eukaryotic-like serine/threonine-protein kinase
MPPRTAQAGGNRRRPAVQPKPDNGKGRAHRYKVQSQIGTGAFCEVLLARDEITGTRVAMKRLHSRLSSDPEARARLAREARVLQSIRHPGIVPLLDTRLDGHRPFIILERLGVSLEQRLSQGQVQDTVACKWIATLASAVDALHRSDVLHRDISSANVLLVADGSRVKLVDLGIARVEADDSLTLPGTIMGKRWYLAPEHASGHPHTKESDLYQLGLVSYELVAGKRPWATEPRFAIGRPLPTRRGEQVDRVFARALARDPHKRYRTGTQFAKALAEALRHAPGEHAPAHKRSSQPSSAAQHHANPPQDGAPTRRLPTNPVAPTRRLDLVDQLTTMAARLEQLIDWTLEHAARLVISALVILLIAAIFRVALELLP